MHEHALQQQSELQQYQQSQEQLLCETRLQLQNQLEAAATGDAKLQDTQQQLQDRQQHMQQLTADLTAAQTKTSETLKGLKHKEQTQSKLHKELQALRQEATMLRQRLSQHQRDQQASTLDNDQRQKFEVGLHQVPACHMNSAIGTCFLQVAWQAELGIATVCANTWLSYSLHGDAASVHHVDGLACDLSLLLRRFSQHLPCLHRHWP